MTRYDDRYDEFGYERGDYDGTLELNEYLTPREVMELLAQDVTDANAYVRMAELGNALGQ